MHKFIKSLNQKNLYVVSAGDHEDLIKILEHKGLTKYFKGIFGGPTPKADLLADLNLQGTTVFFGDSEIDYNCAKKFNFDFVFISGACSWPEWKVMLNNDNALILQDFILQSPRL